MSEISEVELRPQLCCEAKFEMPTPTELLVVIGGPMLPLGSAVTGWLRGSRAGTGDGIGISTFMGTLGSFVYVVDEVGRIGEE